MSRQTLTSSFGQIGRHARLLIGVAIVAPIAMATAIAAPTLTGLPESARMVSDEELGEMRGKFIQPESVNFFGIQLSSAWQTNDGIVLTATLQFEADINQSQPQNPTVLASWTHDNEDPTLNIPGTTTPDLGGLMTVNGAVQTNDISGSGNHVRNELYVRVGPFDANNAGFSDAGAPIDASKTLQFADGSEIQFKIDPNGIGLLLQGPDNQDSDGFSLQSVNGNMANQFAQHVQLIGNANAIQNQLDVVIGIDQLQTTQTAVENALSAMKGWGF
jgi:hypothetical protein